MTLANRTFEMYSAEYLCQHIGYAETVEGDYRRWVDRIMALEKLDIDGLTAVASRYWDTAARRSLYLRPRSAKPALVAAGLLRRFAGMFTKRKKP